MPTQRCECGAKYRFPESSLGKRAKCKKCGAVFKLTGKEDDGTIPICDMVPPECSEFEILAWQDHCYVCVNPATCEPWGEPGCEVDAECPVDEYCNFCGTSSCPRARR